MSSSKASNSGPISATVTLPTLFCLSDAVVIALPSFVKKLFREKAATRSFRLCLWRFFCKRKTGFALERCHCNRKVRRGADCLCPGIARPGAGGRWAACKTIVGGEPARGDVMPGLHHDLCGFPVVSAAVESRFN